MLKKEVQDTTVEPTLVEAGQSFLSKSGLSTDDLKVAVENEVNTFIEKVKI